MHGKSIRSLIDLLYIQQTWTPPLNKIGALSRTLDSSNPLIINLQAALLFILFIDHYSCSRVHMAIPRPHQTSPFFREGGPRGQPVRSSSGSVITQGGVLSRYGNAQGNFEGTHMTHTTHTTSFSNPSDALGPGHSGSTSR